MADEADTTTVDETSTTTDAGESTADVQPTAEEILSRFEAQKKVNKDLERKLADARKAADRVSALEADLARLQGKESEYAESQKAREVEAAALAKANERILRAEVRAAAAGKLADPTDALAHIDISAFEVGNDGDVDGAAIAAAISDLIARKPYLAAEGGRRFTSNADGGARKDAAPAQLTDADVKRLYAERKYDEIEAARKAGRLTGLLGTT